MYHSIGDPPASALKVLGYGYPVSPHLPVTVKLLFRLRTWLRGQGLPSICETRDLSPSPAKMKSTTFFILTASQVLNSPPRLVPAGLVSAGRPLRFHLSEDFSYKAITSCSWRHTPEVPALVKLLQEDPVLEGSPCYLVRLKRDAHRHLDLR